MRRLWIFHLKRHSRRPDSHRNFGTGRRGLVAGAGQDFEKLDDDNRIQVALEYLKSFDLVGFQENLAPFYRAFETATSIKLDHTERINSAITSKGLKLNDTRNQSTALVTKNRLDLFIYFEAMKFGCL